MLAICHKSFCNVNHELVPYFKMLLQTILEKSEILSFSFDESLNEITQTSKIDLFVRFWDDTDKFIKVRYYGFTFLGQSRHTNILNHFVGMTKDLKSECLYELSVDGLTVNMKFFQEFSANSKMRIIIFLMILVVALSTLCMELFQSVLKNLDGRNFRKMYT